GQIGGSYQISQLSDNLFESADGRAASVAVLVLVLLGAFTKSAQFPFHFWLPNAMKAPAPVSAYLHSAAMVNAGIYLLARLNSVLGDTLVWQTIVPAIGALSAA